MTATARPLQGLSVLVVDDDRLAAFRLQKRLVAAGARVASGDLATAEPYLGAAALSVVVVDTGLNPMDARRLAPLLAACAVPWVALGDEAHGHLPPASAHVSRAQIPLLVETIAAFCAMSRQ